MKHWVYVILVIFFVSCKSKSGLVVEKPNSIKEIEGGTALSSEKIIQNHYSYKNDFETLYIRSNANYTEEENTKNVSAEIKIKKGEIIAVSIRFLGITVAKALITQKEVKYYEKLNGTYFEGDFKMLSNWLGTDLDYNKLQNMLLGQPIDDLTKEKYTTVSLDTLFKLDAMAGTTEKTFFFDSEKYLLKKQAVIQQDKGRFFEVNYNNFQNYVTALLPSSLLINTNKEKGKVNIKIDYDSVKVNEELTFPYSVPKGYERVILN